MKTGKTIAGAVATQVLRRQLQVVRRIMILLMVLAGQFVCHAQLPEFEYEANTNGGITITRYNGSGGDVEIPPTLNGSQVTAIGGFQGWPPDPWRIGAFYGCFNLASIKIPAGVISILPNAFYLCTGLNSFDVDPENPAFASVEGVLFDRSQSRLVQYPAAKPSQSYAIPATVTNIRSYAFHFAVHLRNVGIPASVFSIGDSAFSSCSNLARASVPGNITMLCRTFSDCTSLADVMLPDSVIDLRGAFSGCTSLTHVTIPPSVSVLTESFKDCRAITNVNLPTNVTALVGTFAGCAALGSITIPQSVTDLTGTFARCAALNNITIPESVTVLEGTFAGCTNLTNVAVPRAVAWLSSTFSGCVGLTNVSLPQGLTNIGSFAFSRCARLADIKIPESVTTIGDRAFTDCIGLLSIAIPAAIAQISGGAQLGFPFPPGPGVFYSYNAFAGCTSLTGFTVDPLNAHYSSRDGLLMDKAGTLLLQFPPGKGGVHMVPEGVNSIGTAAFWSCTNLTRIFLPESVTNIAAFAFFGCSNLMTARIGKNTTEIGEFAFSNCGNLTGIYFEGNAPQERTTVFEFPNKAIVYYLPESIGWTTTFRGHPTAIWTPAIERGLGMYNNTFEFNITWARNRSVLVEACTNLFNPVWVAAHPMMICSGMWRFSDPDSANYSSRFFRVRAE